jgi:hypothetical protein
MTCTISSEEVSSYCNQHWPRAAAAASQPIQMKTLSIQHTQSVNELTDHRHVKRLSSLLFAVLFKSINFTSPLWALPAPSAINPINQRAHQVKCTDRGIYFSWLLPCDSLHFLIFVKAAGSNLPQSRPLLLHVGILGSLCTEQTAGLATDYLLLAS